MRFLDFKVVSLSSLSSSKPCLSSCHLLQVLCSLFCLGGHCGGCLLASPLRLTFNKTFETSRTCRLSCSLLLLLHECLLHFEFLLLLLVLCERNITLVKLLVLGLQSFDLSLQRSISLHEWAALRIEALATACLTWWESLVSSA